MPIDELAIVNRACARIGVEPLESLDEETFGGQAASLVFDSVLDFLLGLYPWTFARTMVQLDYLSSETAWGGYVYVHQLPGARLGPPNYLTAHPTIEDSRLTRFSLQGEKVHSNSNPLYAEIKIRPEPEKWPGTFREAATLLLAAEIAVPAADAESLADKLRIVAYGTPSQNFRGGATGAAIAEDARATPGKRLGANDGGPLVRAWQGTGRW